MTVFFIGPVFCGKVKQDQIKSGPSTELIVVGRFLLSNEVKYFLIRVLCLLEVNVHTSPFGSDYASNFCLAVQLHLLNIGEKCPAVRSTPSFVIQLSSNSRSSRNY
ncbi:hypothetical protein ABIC55_001986 [Sporosarcina psychrophila]|uniref:Uncharacterized protein n=1 Tax=Sporosarcina psychrophila TaxID=1476 RepID=A0ABV2K9Z3_SPOPS